MVVLFSYENTKLVSSYIKEKPLSLARLLKTLYLKKQKTETK